MKTLSKIKRLKLSLRICSTSNSPKTGLKYIEIFCSVDRQRKRKTCSCLRICTIRQRIFDPQRTAGRTSQWCYICVLTASQYCRALNSSLKMSADPALKQVAYTNSQLQPTFRSTEEPDIRTQCTGVSHTLGLTSRLQNFLKKLLKGPFSQSNHQQAL